MIKRWFSTGILFCISGLGLFYGTLEQNNLSDKEKSLLWYCPVCHGQTLFESNHPIARSIEESIQVMKNEGKSKIEINEILKKEYGDKSSRTHFSKNILMSALLIYWLWDIKKYIQMKR
jgi:hypothetical protein